MGSDTVARTRRTKTKKYAVSLQTKRHRNFEPMAADVL